MLLAIADEAKMKALLSAKGFQPAPNARFKALPRCRVYYLFWRGHVTISRYETGLIPFKPEIFREALPELEQTINRLRGIP